MAQLPSVRNTRRGVGLWMELQSLGKGLSPHERALAEALRAVFGELGVGVRRYAARHHRNAGAVSRYLNGTRIPPWEFVLELLRDVTESRGGRAEDLERLRSLHREALKASGSQQHTIQLLSDQLKERQERAFGAEVVLARLAEFRGVPFWARVEAAAALAGISGRESQASQLLAKLATDPDAAFDESRVDAAAALATLDGHKHEGAALLIGFATTSDEPRGGFRRVAAAAILARLDGYEQVGARFLADVATDPNRLDYGYPVYAAEALAALEGHEHEGAGLLRGLATDPTYNPVARLSAVKALAALDGYEQEGAELLAGIAADPASDWLDRVFAAEALAALEGHEQEGARSLRRLATDPALDDEAHVSAAAHLALVDGYGQAAADLLAPFAVYGPWGAGVRDRAVKALADLEALRSERPGHAD